MAKTNAPVLGLFRKRDGLTVAASVAKADTFFSRLVGLLGQRECARDMGLWIVPCFSIHTFAMRFPIDVVFLNERHVIEKILSNVPPWRLCLAANGVRSVVEIQAGRAVELGLCRGDELEFVPQLTLNSTK